MPAGVVWRRAATYVPLIAAFLPPCHAPCVPWRRGKRRGGRVLRIVQFYAIIDLRNVRCEGYEVVVDVQREEFIMLRRKVYDRLLR